MIENPKQIVENQIKTFWELLQPDTGPHPSLQYTPACWRDSVTRKNWKLTRSRLTKDVRVKIRMSAYSQQLHVHSISWTCTVGYSGVSVCLFVYVSRRLRTSTWLSGRSCRTSSTTWTRSSPSSSPWRCPSSGWPWALSSTSLMPGAG